MDFDSTNQNVGRYTSLDKAFYTNTKRKVRRCHGCKLGWDLNMLVEWLKKVNMIKISGPKKNLVNLKVLVLTSPYESYLFASQERNDILHKPQTKSAPTSAGAGTGDAEKDRTLKQRGQLN